jgi:putative ABC transport system permease protein
MSTFYQDLRFAFRQLIKNPGFTAVAIFALALGIGANTAIFSVVNAVLIRPLPFAESERVVLVWNRGEETAGGDRTPLAVADLLDWRAQNQSCESIGAFQYSSYNYTGGQSPERILSARVTADFFTILGAQAASGRTFFPDEERPGAERTVVISHQFRKKYFADDPQVVGRAINLSGASYTIIGVMPEDFVFPNREVELWTALQLQTPTRRGPYFLSGVARLRPGVTMEQARAEMGSMKSSFSGEMDLNVLPINEFIVGDVRPALLALLAAVTLVLLIAAVNVANLLLVRASTRAKEISIRVALGATRWHIIRQLLTESLLLALIGGALGMLLAMWGVDLLLKIAPETIPRLGQIRIDASVLAWSAIVSLVTGVVFGLAPALQSSKPDLNQSLKEGGRSTTEGASKRRWRNLLVISELAMGVMLLVGSGLLIKSFWRLQQVSPGVNPERVLTMRITLRGARYAEPQKVDAFYAKLLEQVNVLPGVEAAAVSNGLPPDSRDGSDDFTIEGRPVKEGQGIADVITASHDYFRALGIPLSRGRYLNENDSKKSSRVMVINETMAREFFPNEDPIGKRVNWGDTDKDRFVLEIVGVVGDVKYEGLEAKTQPAAYQSTVQNTSWGMFLVVKTETSDPMSLVAAIRNEVNALDSELPLSQISTLEQRLSESVAQPRFRTTLIALFAAIALILASVGIYGVISYSVSQRTHEIGIRMALGAQKSDVLKMVVKQGMTVAVTGVAAGLIASAGLTRLLKTLLFGVSATDPLTFAAITLLLVFVALAACYVPARRAARVDPIIALRYE